MQIFNTAILLASASLVSAWCSPFSSAGSLTIYRNTGLGGEHKVISSGDTCVNIVGSWKSAKSNGGYLCTIYRSKGCSGSSKAIDSDGYSNPGWDIQSIECPCV